MPPYLDKEDNENGEQGRLPAPKGAVHQHDRAFIRVVIFTTVGIALLPVWDDNNESRVWPRRHIGNIVNSHTLWNSVACLVEPLVHGGKKTGALAEHRRLVGVETKLANVPVGRC